MRNIDLDFIKKYVNISEEELMMRLVKDAIGLQKEAEANKQEQERQKRLNDPKYRELLFRFWRQVPYLQKYFSDDEILDAAACYMSEYAITKEIHVRGDNENLAIGIFLRHDVHEFTEIRGEWEKKVRNRSSVYLVAADYQNVTGHKAVKKLILDRLPYLAKYDPNIYDLTEQNDWIYVPIEVTEDGETGKRSLYCPVSALMEKNIDEIVETHRNYWHKYGNGKYDEREEAFLFSNEVKAFLAEVVA